MKYIFEGDQWVALFLFKFLLLNLYKTQIVIALLDL
jgi:hypothetical protein